MSESVKNFNVNESDSDDLDDINMIAVDCVESEPDDDIPAKEKKLLVEIDPEVAKMAMQDRLKFILGKSELYSHFMHPNNSPVKTSKGRGVSTARGRIMEADEDKELLAVEHFEASKRGEEAHYMRLTVQPACIQGSMRAYQLEGLNWLIRLHFSGINGILADEMGLGKTLQTISLLGYLYEFENITGPHIVVVPKSTLGNWMNEVRRWCPLLKIKKFHGNKDERERFIRDDLFKHGSYNIIVTSYEVAIREKSSLRKIDWQYLIIDEAHRIKNENSILSKVVRIFKTKNRLLLTGTPLQNNLHELWALLNFLLPDLFSSSEDFDSWFATSAFEGSSPESEKEAMIKQLHKVMRPFLLRRLKSEVEHSIPPKKETYLFVGMATMQKEWYRNILKKDIDAINGSEGGKVRLLNILMQLRKCTNHPYLFDGAEEGPPYFTGDHLINNSGKMIVLHKLLARLKARESRVLIFSQMTRMLDILEDYLLYSGYDYCRIDGSTDGDARDNAIMEFNKPDSSKFIFLLSTRAGGLGINLATADTVVLFDSDWNPQVDLQAQDRAHRIGQKKPVQVFRFISEGTIEEKIIERANFKLCLDAMVIQQGRLSESNRGLNKDELLRIIRFGAEDIFHAETGNSSVVGSNSAGLSDEQIDSLLERGEKRTNEITQKVEEQARTSLLKFSSAAMYEFEGEDFTDVKDKKIHLIENWIEPPKRNSKKDYNEDRYYRNALQTGGNVPKRSSKTPRPPKSPSLNDWQFYPPRLMKLLEKEYEKSLAEYELKMKTVILGPDGDIVGPKELSEEELEEVEKEREKIAVLGLTSRELSDKDKLLQQGFIDWTKKDYREFITACERVGRDNFSGILELMERQDEKSVSEYSAVFWKRFKELEDWERLIEKIEKGEEKLARMQEISNELINKVRRHKDPMATMTFPYAQNQTKQWTEDEDRFLILQTALLGYGAWEEIKLAAQSSWLFRFDWFIRSRQAVDIGRRVDTLIRLIEKEDEMLAEAAKQAAKKKSRENAKEKRKREVAKGSKGSNAKSTTKPPQKRQKKNN